MKISGDVERLEVFSASYNFLDHLPESFARLTSLRFFSNTCSVEFTITTSNMMEMIRECKLAGNRLTEFPLELTNLPNLQLLDLSLNQVGPHTGHDVHNVEHRFRFPQFLKKALAS